jgi:two-component system phosphate regulon sensor histidine kinase PhoR
MSKPFDRERADEPVLRQDTTQIDLALAQTLLERSPNGVIVTGRDGRLLIVNPAVHAIVPVVPDAVGRFPREAVPVPVLAEALDRTCRDEVEFTFESGHRFVLVTVVSLNLADGDDQGRLAILQDVTRLKKAEDYRREFVANVSHELRTPATSIAGYAETLLEDRESLDEDVAQMVDVIYRNAQRLTVLFDDLLHLARIDARDGPLNMDPVVLEGVLREAVDKQRARADDRQITFQVFVAENLAVLSNREALGHVVGNLVENAVKYSFDGGLVTVRANPREGDWVLVEVIDVGLGIDPGNQGRIFERFYRVDKGRSRAAGGTGLGLAIVKRLCQAIGASVDVKSRPGKGSVFRLLLPAVGSG